jgi:N-acetylglutamate synthase-like GNAT family acetyltransferase
MEVIIESLPAFSELDNELCDEIEIFIRDGKLSPEDAAGYDGWLVAKALGSQALVGCIGFEREVDGDTNNIYMQSLVVEKSLRRHNGIGRQLTERLFETVVQPGENLVALTLFWNNGFYEKLGFERVNAKEIKTQDEIAGREKHKSCTAWVKQKRDEG